MPSKQDLVSWFNDAYAMENSVARTLKGHREAAAAMPELAAKISEHIEQTESQAERVKQCIERLGGDVSGFKEAAAAVMGAVQGQVTKPAADAIVKNALADYAAEHLEIASYTALATAAEHLGEEEAARTAEEILAEEEEMAQWLKQRLPELVKNFSRDGE